MNLPYTTLTPILGDEAPYDPNTETTPEFMNGKFKELLENDTAIAQQINVLNKKTSSGKNMQCYVEICRIYDKKYIIVLTIAYTGVYNVAYFK